jgi:hypothetical protein
VRAGLCGFELDRASEKGIRGRVNVDCGAFGENDKPAECQQHS